MFHSGKASVASAVHPPSPQLAGWELQLFIRSCRATRHHPCLVVVLEPLPGDSCDECRIHLVIMLHLLVIFLLIDSGSVLRHTNLYKTHLVVVVIGLCCAPFYRSLSSAVITQQAFVYPVCHYSGLSLPLGSPSLLITSSSSNSLIHPLIPFLLFGSLAPFSHPFLITPPFRCLQTLPC